MDAAYDRSTGWAGAGVIAWNGQDRAVGAAIRRYKARSVEEAELIAVEIAVELAKALGGVQYRFEGDNASIIQALQSPDCPCSWGLAAVRNSILRSSAVFRFCQFKWINRQFNGEAHDLAQWASHGQGIRPLPNCMLKHNLFPWSF